MTTAGTPTNETATLFFIGHHDSLRANPVGHDVLSGAQELGYDFVTTPITSNSFHDKIVETVQRESRSRPWSGKTSNLLPTISPLSPSDSTLQPNESNSALLGLVSPWIELGSSDPLLASISRQVLNLEVAYAAFCGFNNLVIWGPSPGTDVVRYARSIREALGLGPYLHLHILLPMIGELDLDKGDTSHLAEFAESSNAEEENGEQADQHPFQSWEDWNTIRTVCSYSHKLSVALELPRQLPISSLQSRWLSEPIRLLFFPHTTFLRNAKGYPVLSKQHQRYLSQFARFRWPPWMLLCDIGLSEDAVTPVQSTQTPEPTPAEATSKTVGKENSPTLHLQYLRHMQQTQPTPPPMEMFGAGYEDFLQSPLQPLTDNLESVTYEGFEKDPVKYEWYERAIFAALKDLASTIGMSRDIVVAIAGAGRGPLVTRALKASQKTGIPIRSWAVEKNPNALLLLQRRNATDSTWNQQVQIVKSDMRHWPGPTATDGTIGKVDILVSELLGSFADNELSPECLDGAQHVLHPEHGINIPQSYSAHLTPISTPRLYSDLYGRSGAEKWELPYVVMLHQYDYLCPDPKSESPRIPQVKTAWSFSHPLPPNVLQQSHNRAGGSFDAGGWTGGNGVNEHNARACTVTLSAPEPGVCHGLAGYFESVLYDSTTTGKVEISTNPVTMEQKSRDMISWFPIFFPLKTPIVIPEESELCVSMWRQTDDRSVWYEWLVEVFESGKDGRRRKVAMSELHSSRKNACLM